MIQAPQIQRLYVFLLNKRSGEFFEGTLVNADFTERWPFSPMNTAGVPADLLVSKIDAFRLIDLHAEGKLTGRLAEIAATLKEDDNPVMMIVTFK